MATMAVEQRREDAWLFNSRRCSAAFSSLRNLDLRFHRRLPTTAAPQRIVVGPFCRKGLRGLPRPATRYRLIEGQHDAAERTLALGFELRSKVLLGKEDLHESQTGRRG